MESKGLMSCTEEWKELEKEFIQLEEEHRQYTKSIAEMKSLQKKCFAGIAHQRYRIKAISDSIMKSSSDDDENVKEIKQQMASRKLQFREMEENLPHKNGIYLRIILGQVNVSLLSKEDRYAYKQDYEHFKLIITIICMVFSFLLLTVFHSRWLDAAFHFLLVWYYCTMTIREHILVVNGSRIKGWWMSHHFISTVCAGVMLIWPAGTTYLLFRKQFMVFSLYLSIVQVMQVKYQKGVLYRLRTLGERHTMDITVEGFHSWMWKGLSFVLPFLVGAYVFQIYNAYSLFLLSMRPDCVDWQVPALSFIFTLLFLGNSLTTLAVVRQKLKSDGFLDLRLKNKYRFNHTKST